MQVVRKYQKVPPQAFQDVVVQQANTYYVIDNARFEGANLVADRIGAQHGSGWESLCSMLDGLIIGYTAAMPKPTAWTLTHIDRILKPAFKKMTEREVYEAHHLDFYGSAEPTAAWRTKTVVEKFTTMEEAHYRRDELDKRPWPNHNLLDQQNVVYDRDAECTF